MPAHWFYINAASTEPEGPCTLAQLATFFKQKKITAETFVWHGKKVKEWTKINQVKGLAERLKRPAGGHHANQSSRGSVAELFSASPRFNPLVLPNESHSEIIHGESTSHPTKMRSLSMSRYRDSLRENDRETLMKKHLHLKEENEKIKVKPPRESITQTEVGGRLVQVANLLVKTQDELERKSKENEIILQENRNHKARMAELEQKLKNEMQIKNNLRKQWKKAQIGYEAEIKQYQSQLDIFFAAETELGNDSDGRSEIQLNLSFVE